MTFRAPFQKCPHVLLAWRASVGTWRDTWPPFHMRVLRRDDLESAVGLPRAAQRLTRRALRDTVRRGSCLGLLLVAGLGTASVTGAQTTEDEQIVPLAPVDVTARFPLTPPEVKKVSKPTYPEAARKREEQGTVQLVVKVLSDGHVGEVNVKKSSGSKALDEAALAEAKGWQFTPGRRGPKAVDSWVEIPVRFQLTEP